MASRRPVREGEVCFSSRCGARAQLSSEGRKASRQDPSSCYDGALVVTNRPLKVNDYFEVLLDSVKEDKWTGSISLGVLKGKPDKISWSTIDAIAEIPPQQAKVWFLSEDGIQSNRDKSSIKRYGLNVDAIPQGSRIGMMITKKRELHFFLNGKDCGTALEDVPSNVYVVIDVYAQCYSVSIVPRSKHSVQSIPSDTSDHDSSSDQDDEDADAFTQSAGTQGFVDFTEQELRLDLSTQELLQARKTSKSRSTGFVPKVHDFTRQVLPDVQSDDFTHQVDPDFNRTKPSYDFSQQVLPGASSTDEDFTHQVLPSQKVESKKVKTSSYTQKGSHSKFVPDNVDFSSQSLEGLGEEKQQQSHKKQVPRKKKSSSDVPSSVPGSRVRFSRHCGSNIRLSDDGRTATRVQGYNRGLILSEDKIPNDKVFEVVISKMHDQWDGTISLGVTSLPPQVVCQYTSSASINEGKNRTFVHFEDCLYRDGEEIKDLRVNLKHCKQGEVIGVFCSRDPNYKTDTMYLIRHKKVVRQIAIKVPKERYVIIDVYGMCTCVKLLPLREAPIMPRNEDKRLPAPEKQVPIPVEDEQKVKHEHKEPEHHDPPEKLRAKRKPKEDTSLPQRDCEYKELCRRYLQTLDLPAALLDPTPGYNKCFCLECHRWRKDDDIYTRGNPPEVYELPQGWCRFALKTPPRAQSVNAFNDYHIGFHGTKAEHVRTILDCGTLLLPGDVALGGQVISPPKEHFSEDKKPEGHDLNRIFLSPSIKYAGCSAYSKGERFDDGGKVYNAKVAFQVLIRPGAYEVSQETVGATSKGIYVDSHFANHELEWSTKEKVATILYGLLVELRQI